MVATLRGVLTDGSDVTAPAPRWRSALALLLSLAGLGFSVYLTIDHFAKIRLACSDSGLINCQKVTTSAQSHFLGVPVAVLGLAFFVVMTAINLPPAWRAADRRVHLARLALAILGMAFVLYLVSAEVLIIGNICMWCTFVHATTFLLLVLLASTTPPMLGWGAVGVAPTPARGAGRAPGGRGGGGRGGGGRGGGGRGGGRGGGATNGRRPHGGTGRPDGPRRVGRPQATGGAARRGR